MNRKIFLTAGAVLLAVVGVFAGRASKKGTATALYYKSAGSHCVALFTSGIPSNFTTTAGSNQASLKTEGGVFRAVFETNTCGNLHKVYFIK